MIVGSKAADVASGSRRGIRLSSNFLAICALALRMTQEDWKTELWRVLRGASTGFSWAPSGVSSTIGIEPSREARGDGETSPKSSAVQIDFDSLATLSAGGVSRYLARVGPNRVRPLEFFVHPETGISVVAVGFLVFMVPPASSKGAKTMRQTKLGRRLVGRLSGILMGIDALILLFCLR